ncbi:hypothetical protein [Planctomyces sp. SH-PL14]|uniref:type IV pilus modification PilV family protein n=1 Tax=Planctomyces sp. SH-PL14 TaxID=1632864 RepID=UPI0009466BB8|nr:hypothetical protein [Planctomyces sp. SH-PL14]
MIRSLPPQVSPRRGATLTEVLMAIFVMSIGVVSVITLFPLAILRAVHATQLTNSKVLEQNIEEFLHANPWMWRGSPVDPKLNSTDTEFVKPCVIDPLGKPVMGTYYPAYGRQFGNRGSGSVPTDCIRRISPFAQLTNNAGTAVNPSYETAAENVDWPVTDHTWLDAGICALPDSWNTVADDIPEAISATEVDFSAAGPALGASGGNVRLTLISLDGTRSITRLGTTNNYKFTKLGTEPNIPLPDFDLASVGRAVVEANESRYSWVITCPSPADAPPQASCVVFFRRAFDPDEEFVYDNGGSAPMTATSSTVDITWGAGQPEPVLREGNYLFDAQNAIWYRIRSYTITETGTTGSATIELDRPARKPATMVMLPHGLVHVFDLEVRGQ